MNWVHTAYSESSKYISGVKYSGHRPNMAANGALRYVSLSRPTRSFMFTCYVKIMFTCYVKIAQRELNPT